MKKLMEYTFIEFKMLLRIPIALFFTLFFPAIMLVVYVFANGNNLVYDNVLFVDLYLPMMILLSLFSSGITSFAVLTAENKGQNIWTLYRLRGFKLYQIIICQLLVNLLVVFLSTVVLILFSRLVFGANIPEAGELFLFFVKWIVIAISIFMIGFVIGVSCKNSQVAQSVANPILFALMILSGIMVDISVFPESLRSILVYLPTYQANIILVNSWNSFNNTSEIKWGVIIIWILISIFIVVYKLYKDEYQRV